MTDAADELERAAAAFVEARQAELDGFEGLPALDELDADDALLLADEFELVRRIGEGGMGIFYEARPRTALGRPVAVKLLRPFASEAGRERFRREVRAVLALDHPGIVPVVAAEVDGEAPFLAMKLVDGAPLDSLIAWLREQGGVPAETGGLRTFVQKCAAHSRQYAPSTPATDRWRADYGSWAAQLALDVADALQHAHERSIVHRDIKPGNLVVTPESRAVLLDFGIASTDDAAVTRTGDFVGTLHYSAPEQILGRPIDARVDVYALGATLFELLTLARPHSDVSPSEILRRGIDLEPPGGAVFGRRVPEGLRRVCRNAMAGDPEARYASAGDMAADLRSFLAGHAVAPLRLAPLARLRRWPRRHPRAAALVFVVLLAAAFSLRWARQLDQAHAGVRSAAALLDDAREVHRGLRSEAAGFARWLDASDAISRVDLRTRDARRAQLRVERERFVARCEDASHVLLAGLARAPDHATLRGQLAELRALSLLRALDECVDVLAPETLLRLERDLAAADPGADHAALLDPLGSLELTSDPSPCQVTVERAGQVAFRGSTPCTVELPEGTYDVTLTHGERFATRLPLLVRRAAVYAEDPDALPPRAQSIELWTEAPAPGFVPVAAGWTLLEDSPPRWRRIEAFEIQEFEVTFATYLAWLEATRPEPLDEFLPADEVQVFVLEAPDGTLALAEGVDPTWPVFGLQPRAMEQYAHALDPPLTGVGRDHYSDLPDPAEWTRAARGADGRRYPWGVRFDWGACAAYASEGDPQHLPRPYPIGAFERDISPFGVRDLAGSVAEFVRPYRVGRHGDSAARGGCYATRDAREAQVASSRDADRASSVVGLRVVRRRMPPWLSEPIGPPAAFHDDFERPDAGVVGGGWHEWSADPLTSIDPALGGDLVWLESGRLVCTGERGQFSATGRAVRRVSPGNDFLLRVILSYDSPDPDGPRSPQIALLSGLGTGSQGLSLGVHPSGTVNLGAPDLTLTGQIEGFELRRWYIFELIQRGTEVEGRIWPRDTPRPAEPVVFGQLASAPAPYALLQVVGCNFVAGRVEVDELSLELLD